MTSFPRWRRVLLPACALWLSVLSGCEESDPAPDAGPSPTEDAGTPDAGDAAPWDGTYTVLEERGDWIDRGPYAPCTLRSGVTPSCDDLTPELFDLSACDTDSLANVEPQGIYQAGTRYDSPLQDGGMGVSFSSLGFRLHSDGGTETLGAQPLVTRIIDDGRFFIASRRTTSPTLANAYAGCQVPRTGVITGCFIRCVNGRVSRTGTFEAHRMTWPEGEAESSGGLRLRSESHVVLGEPVDVYVAKDHAYVVSMNRPGDSGGLTVFDVSDRSHPVFKTSIHIPGDSNWNGAWTKGDALYIASDVSGVIVYDITRPSEPAFLRSMPGGQRGVHTVLVDGERLYAAANDGRTLVYDVSRPLEPVLLQSLTVGAPHDHFAYEGRLYISNSYDGYYVMDVTDLEDVKFLGKYVHGAYAHHSAVGTFAGRTIAFEGAEFASSHVRVLDVTDPANIVKIGEYRKRPVTSIHNMILRGTRLYIAWYHEGLRVLDVSNPTRPREVAHYNVYRETDPGRWDTVLDGAYGVRVPGDGAVYVVDSSRGLLIFDDI
ncbi:hypothetical protein HPC49_29955 [Pyxidicoccus fallax]|uniref:Lipoprotein n=1 Tax=Pyxidicoccus fallax TaxID=394095 RepID=A0A848LVJ0_9BACT|nr:hypothetical protein [Pyxidicoccus fallax]NMO21324.1 hypothetical protein [Pyxidicoccus fallax]NPC82433.1 hypothetical protein [Pyxidicoccus fallax]